MKQIKSASLFFLTSCLCLTAFAASPQQTVVTYKIINKGSTPIESFLPEVPRILPNESATFSDIHDLKPTSLRNGDSRSEGRGFVFFSGDKMCNFSTSITLKKTANVINFGTENSANSQGKQLTGCSIDLITAPSKAPYSYDLEMIMN